MLCCMSLFKKFSSVALGGHVMAKCADCDKYVPEDDSLVKRRSIMPSLDFLWLLGDFRGFMIALGHSVELFVWFRGVLKHGIKDRL